MAPKVDEQDQVIDEVDESQPVVNENPEGTENAEDAGESSQPVQATQQQQPDYESKYRALEEQNRRYQERNSYLEQTARLLEQQSQRQYQQPPQQQQRGNELAPELADLDKTLDPLFQRRLAQSQQPVVETISRLYDEHDASRFEMYLMRNHPEVFDEEGGLDRTFQDVEVIRRQAAQTYGQWLSRVDAFLYAQGVRNVQTQAKSRKEKKTAQVQGEQRRVQSARAATSGISTVAPRKAPGAELTAIREKANRGERLKPDERAKLRDALVNVAF
jgi:hypothetical protein